MANEQNLYILLIQLNYCCSSDKTTWPIKINHSSLTVKNYIRTLNTAVLNISWFAQYLFFFINAPFSCRRLNYYFFNCRFLFPTIRLMHITSFNEMRRRAHDLSRVTVITAILYILQDYCTFISGKMIKIITKLRLYHQNYFLC